MTGSLPLSPQVFSILASLVEELTGLHYRIDECELLADKLSPRAVERGFGSLLDYYYFLRYDPAVAAELPHLIDALVVNETYFFRETPALELVVNRLVPELLDQGVEPRIWCAACSTGEEPFTLAMLLDAAGLLGRVEIVASDISQRVLNHARAGIYRRRSLRALPESAVGRWLTREGDAVKVAPRIAEAVELRRVNLVSCSEFAAAAPFDLVICRNVLIYFSDETIQAVLTTIAQRLKPGGCLLVGASESLMRFDSTFRCEEHGGVFFYRKTAE